MRMKSRPALAILACVITLGGSSRIATASGVYQSLNETLTPGPYYWAVSTGNIGWYWTPTSDVLLEGIQTQLRTGFVNINNNFTFTTTLYSDRPAAGGTSLGSFTWNGVTFVDGPWLGGSFPAPLSLTGGTSYFVGMSGWEQGLAFFGGTGGSGVNWIDPPDQAGAENLGAGSGYFGTDFDTQMNPGPTPANIDSPVIRFIEVPEPASLLMLGMGAATVLVRRRRGA